MREHTVSFEDCGGGFILSEEEMRDMVDLFFRWGPSKFKFEGHRRHRDRLGECQRHFDGSYTIRFFRKNIEDAFRAGRPCGGTVKPPSLKAAVGLIIVHELQHANQFKVHAEKSKFWGNKGGLTETGRPKMQRYWGRACEREARMAADERMSEVCAYFGQETPAPRKVCAYGDAAEEALNVASILRECSEVSMEDVRDELRQSKILNPSSVKVVVEKLREWGIEVSTGPAR